MSRKIKYTRRITEDQIPQILKEKYPNNICPECHKNGVYAGCIETQYEDKIDEMILLSFDVFCKECGAFLTKWDNTNRQYFLGKRE